MSLNDIPAMAYVVLGVIVAIVILGFVANAVTRKRMDAEIQRAKSRGWRFALIARSLSHRGTGRATVQAAGDVRVA